jgi:phosphonate transport system ATP-binding protein
MRLDLTNLCASHLTARPNAKAALSGVTLTVAAGAQVGVIVPSGAVKNTLLNALACALRPSSGTLALGGQTPWTLPASTLRTLRGSLFWHPSATPAAAPAQRHCRAGRTVAAPRPVGQRAQSVLP